MSSETVDNIIEWLKILLVTTLITWALIWMISALGLGIYVLINGLISSTQLFLFIRWVLAICLGTLGLLIIIYLLTALNEITS